MGRLACRRLRLEQRIKIGKLVHRLRRLRQICGKCNPSGEGKK
jgi:hypothetical protein